MRSKKTVKFLSLLLAGALLAGSVSVQPVQAATINSAKKKAQELEAKKKKAEKDKASLNARLNKIISDLKKAQNDVDAKEIEIGKAEDELIAAKIKEDDQYERMKIRIKYMYENGNTEMIAVLLTAEDMSDFLNKAEYVEQISEYDRQMLVEFQKVVKEVQEKEAALKSEKKKLIKLQNTLSGKQKEVEKLLSSKSAEISDLKSQIGQNQKVLNDLIARAKEAERRRREAEEAARRAAQNQSSNNSHSNSHSNSGGGGGGSSAGSPVVSGNGQLSNPCPGGSVSSEFGPRKAPVAGASTYHLGRDYAAGTGTPVYASADGTVVTATYNSIRGNYVVINHGNGLQTYYQHFSATYVSPGQKVVRGQNIGAVGSTGIVSGAHLHYEVHVNGSPVDPRRYL